MKRAADKIATGDRVREILDRWRAAGDSLAVAHGRFDLLEAAHVRALSSAKGGARRLLVEIAADRAVAAAPVLGESERALLAAALRIVDLVTVVAAKSPNAADLEADFHFSLAERLRERHGGA